MQLTQLCWRGGFSFADGNYKHNNRLILSYHSLHLIILESGSESRSVVSNSLKPQNSPGQNTGVDSLSFFQGIFPTHRLNPGLLHCRPMLYQLSHMVSPNNPWDKHKNTDSQRWTGLYCHWVQNSHLTLGRNVSSFDFLK